MGLSGRLDQWLAAAATRRPHVLVAAICGYDLSRIAAEAAVLRQGGVLSASPADADVLLIAGQPGAQLAPAIEAVWAQLPGPRARATLSRAEEADEALTCALELLRDTAAQRRDATDRTARLATSQQTHGDHPGDGHGMHASQDEHDGHDNDQQQGAGQHGAHGHDMGAMDMPGGLGMADRAPDRDGLMLDVLHVSLGPVLADWPAGLVVDVQLQGDVIQQADARFLDDAGQPDRATLSGTVAALDALARLLSVADWPAAAYAARMLRNDLAIEPQRPDAAARLDKLSRRVRRSRILAARGAGLGVLTDDYPNATVRGDVTTRWQRWLHLAHNALTDAAPVPLPDAGLLRDRATLIGRLVVGLDLAAARLVIASLDPGAASFRPAVASRS